jgi:hypothetical protein
VRGTSDSLGRMSRNMLAASEHLRPLPFPPEVYGLLAFLILCALLLGVLVFGKGRPHT